MKVRVHCKFHEKFQIDFFSVIIHVMFCLS